MVAAAPAAPPARAHPIPPPRVLAHPSASAPELVTQGAEGLLYRTTYLDPSVPSALKHRPPKPYRHPALDARLTRQRILAEARVLARCRREGVAVPALYCVDEAAGWLMMEWVDGPPVRAAVDRWLLRAGGEAVAEATPAGGAAAAAAAPLVALLRRVGAAVGALHAAGVVHGDLTTSNMMLRPERGGGAGTSGGGDEDAAAAADRVLEGEIVIIDFGLASQGTHEEERAVDLYVLERAFLSTHPRTEKLFGEVLEGYRQAFKGARLVLRKLEDVRMRGRKRSMIG